MTFTPAAADTIARFMKQTNTVSSDYDCILTGDLGSVGSQLLCQILFHKKAQDVHAGASGCGCSAALVSTLFRRKIEKGELQRVLFVGTGALMSPLSVRQGESIPGIAHAVLLTKK